MADDTTRNKPEKEELKFIVEAREELAGLLKLNSGLDLTGFVSDDNE